MKQDYYNDLNEEIKEENSKLLTKVNNIEKNFFEEITKLKAFEELNFNEKIFSSYDMENVIYL